MPLRKRNCLIKLDGLRKYPDNKVKQFKCYVINGLKFCTKDSEASRKTQNDGVCVVIEGVLLIMVY